MPNSHPEVEGEPSTFLQALQPLCKLCMLIRTCVRSSRPTSLTPADSRAYCPRRSRSSFARVSGSSRSRRRDAASSTCAVGASSSRNVLEAIFATSCPDVPRTAASEETRQTRSPVAVLGGEPLEQRVRVGRVAHRERPDLAILAGAVEDEEAACTLHGDEARELVDELADVRSARRRGAGCSRRRGRASARRSSCAQDARALAPCLVEQDGSGDADVERLDAVGERDRDRSRRTSCGRADGRPCPRRRRRARRRRSGRRPTSSRERRRPLRTTRDRRA